MVDMLEIYILGAGMGSKMLALVCWNLMCFYASVMEYYMYIYFRKTVGKYTNFEQKCWKNFHRKL